MVNNLKFIFEYLLEEKNIKYVLIEKNEQLFKLDDKET